MNLWSLEGFLASLCVITHIFPCDLGLPSPLTLIDTTYILSYQYNFLIDWNTVHGLFWSPTFGKYLATCLGCPQLKKFSGKPPLSIKFGLCSSTGLCWGTLSIHTKVPPFHGPRFYLWKPLSWLILELYGCGEQVLKLSRCWTPSAWHLFTTRRSLHLKLLTPWPYESLFRILYFFYHTSCIF